LKSGKVKPSVNDGKRNNDMTETTISTAERQRAIRIASALYETISALGGIPSGHLYARVMGHMSLDYYQLMIGTLIKAGLVTEENHFLKAVPQKAK
jgi:hypothetical protein